MPHTFWNLGGLHARDRAARHRARKRRASHAGYLNLFRTHTIAGTTTTIAVSPIATGTLFPDRTSPVTFSTTIEIIENGGTHAGVIFEFGDTARGAAMVIANTLIGFHAGAQGGVNGVTVIGDYGGATAVGREMRVSAACIPGNGKARLFVNGKVVQRAQASSGSFGTPNTWSGAGNGSFAAAASGTIVGDLAAVSGAPAGFRVIAPLSVYVGQVPRRFE